MKCSVLLAATLACVVGCRDAQAPPVAVSVELLPSSITFDALYETVVVVATVKDRHGDAIPNAVVRGGGGGGNLGVHPTDSGRTATIQSLEPGPVYVLATSGTGTARLDVITTRVPATVAIWSGTINPGSPVSRCTQHATAAVPGVGSVTFTATATLP